jgi:hypothetical protein
VEWNWQGKLKYSGENPCGMILARETEVLREKIPVEWYWQGKLKYSERKYLWNDTNRGNWSTQSENSCGMILTEETNTQKIPVEWYLQGKLKYSENPSGMILTGETEVLREKITKVSLTNPYVGTVQAFGVLCLLWNGFLIINLVLQRVKNVWPNVQYCQEEGVLTSWHYQIH